MATYVLGADDWLLARAEDLLHVEVLIVPDRDAVALLLPNQHVLEHSWAPDPDGILRITQPHPDDSTAVLEVAPIGADPVAFFAGAFTGYGTNWGNGLSLDVPAATVREWVGHLLEHLDRQWVDAAVEFPTLLHLATYGRSRWSLSPDPPSPGAWSGIWRAELLETDSMDDLPGPLVRVAEAVQLGLGPGSWFGPPGFFVFPLSTYTWLKDSVFEARLALSMVGATGRLRGPHWPVDMVPPAGALASYTYVAQDGREVESVAVLRGHLSSGHAVELQTVTTREFARGRFNGLGFAPDPYTTGEVYVAAHLTSTTTLTVREDVVTASTAGSPFRSLRLADVGIHQVDRPSGPADAFWVTRGGVDVQFSLVATDWEGGEKSFSLPLLFLSEGSDVGQVRDGVFAAGADGRKRADLAGAPVVLADRSARDDVPSNAVTLPVHAVHWNLTELSPGVPTLAPKTVEVALEAVGRMTDTPGLTTCTLRDRIGADGTFLDIAGDGLNVRLAADRAGGLAAPAMRLGAVRALEGAVPVVSPQQAFADARLLGVPLVSLLDDLRPGDPRLHDPTLRTEHRGDAVVTSYHWTPALLEAEEPVPGVMLGEGATLDLLAEVSQPVGPPGGEQPGPPRVRVEGTLTDATVSVVGIIGARIGRLSYRDEPDTPPRVSADDVRVTFDGDLRFVERFAREVGGFGDGGPVHVTAQGITASYALPVPPFGFGVFSLTNVSLGAELSVPFDGPSVVRFHFAERHAPFSVGVAIFGGGGYLAVTATTAGLERVEASLEFGGLFQISVAGLVEGQVHAMGGVTLVWDQTVTLEGYLRCGGHVEVLDLVGLSVEFEVALGYQHDDGGASRIYGRATVTVGVELVWINESVSFSVEKSFPTSDRAEAVPAAGGGPPADLFADEASWAEICEAFG